MSAKAVQALQIVQHWVSDNGLTLHPTKTRIVDSRQDSLTFLGYEFRGHKHWPRKKSLEKLKAAVREKTRRNNGTSLKCIVTNLNRTLVGWFHYFQRNSYRPVFRDLDGWIRMRLCSLLPDASIDVSIFSTREDIFSPPLHCLRLFKHPNRAIHRRTTKRHETCHRILRFDIKEYAWPCL